MLATPLLQRVRMQVSSPCQACCWHCLLHAVPVVPQVCLLLQGHFHTKVAVALIVAHGLEGLQNSSSSSREHQ
jgi:hypothetical protein